MSRMLKAKETRTEIYTYSASQVNEVRFDSDGNTVVLQIIYGFMLHFIYNYFQDYLECNITLFKPDYVH